MFRLKLWHQQSFMTIRGGKDIWKQKYSYREIIWEMICLASNYGTNRSPLHDNPKNLKKNPKSLIDLASRIGHQHSGAPWQSGKLGYFHLPWWVPCQPRLFSLLPTPSPPPWRWSFVSLTLIYTDQWFTASPLFLLVITCWFGYRMHTSYLFLDA